ncbi:Ppx/GppA phosphatase family protein [Saccharothrix espanaensis]|uniref:Ppx/GppA phosphatase N-terminal domain-containing protein n=1 Tax=Saccharothrix espanaensis (strain ATCC 51144 / DSM 44229 / JCM 9112 / NBRC 15066 / NRRL 15764) TaxID=1179773 RepID=K0JVD5_SACES|nr:hypothetical protein [Saccharothrix espanaensis]CCH31830.1 hypothetical protein BN6_45500 [Saccharothrix espanaensis DSM 44229]
MPSGGTVAVLDVGCFSAHLVVVRDGALLDPLVSHKVRLRLDRAVDFSGRVSRDGVARIASAVRESQRLVRRSGVDTFLPFVTSVVRDATNADAVVAAVEARTGVELRRMSGRREAELSYLAARRWFGWSAGPLTVLDVGGGTVEIAVGDGAAPAFAHSLPLGARTLTREWERGGKPARDGLRAFGDTLARRIREAMPPDAVDRARTGRAVGCSKLFQQLARLAGARPQRDGPLVPRRLAAADLAGWVPRLAELPAADRARLPGISRHRAGQAVAGAVVARALMVATGHDVVDICPWSTKEGLLITLSEQPPRCAEGDACAVA